MTEKGKAVSWLRYNTRIILIVPFLMWLFSSCSVKKFLGPDESLLKAYEIEVKTENLKKNVARDLEKDLNRLVTLKPNTNILFVFPRERRLLRKRANPNPKRDTTWLSNFITENFSERPAFLDTPTVEFIAGNMERYLNSRGYFHANVEYKLNSVSEKFSEVTYVADPGRLYTAKKLDILSYDTLIMPYIKKEVNPSSVRGDPVSKSLYETEVKKITNTLRNNGYFEFYPDYISNFRTYDTSSTSISLALDIDTPEDSVIHQRYYINEIYVYPEYDPLSSQTYTEEEIGGIKVRYVGDKSLVRPSILRSKIDIQRGDPFNESMYNETIRQLSNLSIFRPPRITAVKSKLVDSLLDYHIYLPRNKKKAFNFNLDLFYSTLSSFRQIGVSGEVVYTNRNIFGGSEQLTFTVSPGIEWSRTLANTLSFNTSLDLTIPRLHDIGLIRLGSKLPLISSSRYTDIKRNAQTNYRLSFAYYDYQTFYLFRSFNALYGVSYRRDELRNWKTNIVGINYWSPEEKEQFDEIAGDNQLFRNSFEPVFSTGLIFRDITYRYQSRMNERGWQKGFLGYFELSGFEAWVATNITEAFGSDPILQELRIGSDTVAFSKYVKFEFEHTRTKRLDENQSLAFRANIGITRPFGRTSAVPYNIKFYQGGPYSMRAWRIRELGPGGVNNQTAEELNVPFFQAGDMKLELNAEWRFKLFWLVEGAAFVDIGNIWDIGENEDEPLAQFKWDTFYKQIAIGSGFGIRLDFNYFIFRLDAGHRIKNNYFDEINNTYWAVRGLRDFKFSKLTWNLGIGYPF
jgi:hypothetical protein